MESPVADDYLKAIYHHTEWQNDPITPSQLAAVLGLAPSSVTEMVKKLAAQGLVTHRPYGPVSLTPAGQRRAAGVIRRHRLIETWLVREFGYAWDEVHDEAEVLEHALSDRLLEGIDARLGRPRFDPHGDAIPDATGSVEREPFVLLSAAVPGHAGRVLRVSDRDPELLRALVERGIDVGHELEVVSESTVRADGVDVELPAGAAESVWLTR
ncbi:MULTISPECIES: metal-dependent transcriptional regulator [Microbacterium]|uniref:metal-dependent transcriptional regulator n=1 Tax=Microbacterium TaxID=33882 RepID=UPI002787F503|nr:MULTISPECIES: metal-dependent transcriptional regulator [Microbacterium]MDQ1075267.1 DtxR family Mn-dependent transcriptional regulator [Microbacterium sp. SORGH_AS_0969]MDQ1115497.1 DtxR family Mn-dependent transcriptional regulator [Microbacterium testaceum]